MAIINLIDLGAHPTWAVPLQTRKGQIARLKTQAIQIRGGKEFFYMEGAEFPDRIETVWVTSATPAATMILVNQVLELVGNPDLNKPCYIQWASGGGTTVADSQDGWYYIVEAEPDTEFSWSTSIPVKLAVRKASSGTPRYTSVWNSGISLSTTYTGLSQNWYFLPVNSSSLISTGFTRTGGEGIIPGVLSPGLNPSPFLPPASVSDWFRGSCHVYDAMATIATNPVPTNGTFAHGNWVEVEGIDHRFIGDTVITNGLILLTSAIGQTGAATAYVWGAGSAWVKCFTINGQDNLGSHNFNLRQLTLQRLGLEEVSAIAVWGNSDASLASLNLRLQRGAYFIQADVRPLTETNTNAYSLYLNFPAAVKAIWNESSLADGVLGTTSLSATATYGYGAAVISNSLYPFVGGFLYQNPPATYQPISTGANGNIGLGDTSGPAQSAFRKYGIFVASFSTTQNLQAEAEGGTLSGGAVSVADATASAANAVKVPSGTTGQIPAPNPLPTETDGGAAAGTLVKGGYTMVQTWTDAVGETTSSGDNTSNLTVSLAQTGVVVLDNSSASANPTLPGGSTAGNMLVAFVSNSGNYPYSAPAGWTQVSYEAATGVIDAEVWIYPNNPGGITTAAFTISSTLNHQSEMSEWRNVALVSVPDAQGTNHITGLLSYLPVSTNGLGYFGGGTVTSVTQAGDVAIAGWHQQISAANTVGFTTPAGWTRLTDNGATSSTRHIDLEYMINPSTGALSATLTSSRTNSAASGFVLCLKAAPLNTTFLTANGDKLHVAAIAGAPATTTNGKFYFTQVPATINAGLAATAAVSGGAIAAFDITANPGSATSPPATNTTGGTPAVDLFGTSWIPPVGAYNVWFRIKVATASGSAKEMKVGLWDATSGVYVSNAIFTPSQVTTGYVWYPAGSLVVPPAGHNVRFRLNNNALTTTDWFIDEAVMVPITSTSSYSFPQDLWQQFMFDRVTEIIQD